jgi:trypsin
MRSLVLLSIVAVLGSGGCAASSESSEEATDEGALVGGSRDLRWSASGYLAKGPSMGELDTSKPACGATLISSNVVVTAAHCVGDASQTFAFGTGDVGSGAVVKVVERHVHPKFHAEAQGSFDPVHALRKYDVAYLVLERDVVGVEPAALPDAKPAIGCNVQAIGYHGQDTSPGRERTSAPACVLLRVTLGTDPIFEVHPAGGSALCIADGDEGSPVVDRDANRQVLVGFFVGSVTQGFTDCRRGTQFLDGYESAFGYREFFEAGIAAAKNK